MHTKPLRELTAEDLGDFAFRAMTTEGDVDDFRHFLPRILELVLRSDFPVDQEVVFGKLAYGKWKEWPLEERAALEMYLTEVWAWARRRPPAPSLFEPAEIGSWLCAIARVQDDLGEYLNAWASDPAPEARANLVRFRHDAVNGVETQSAFWEELDDQWRQVMLWLARQPD